MTQRKPLLLALFVTIGIAALEFWGGYASHSLALTTDAVHVLVDTLAIGLALIAAIGASRPPDPRRTFGYGRIEILGALVNGTILCVATVAIVASAIHRFSEPVEPEGIIMIVVAAIGLACNAGVGVMLHRAGKSDLNVRAALFHVLGDALGAFAVIVGGVLIAFTRQSWIDPLLSLLVAAIIVTGVLRVMRDATNVLLESVPSDVDAAELAEHIRQVAGVAGVHDLHVWSISSDSYALSAHVMLDDRRLSEATQVLQEINGCLETHFRITHATIQFECDNCPVPVKH